MKLRIIRHGPKQPVEKHVSGIESKLDDKKEYKIRQFARSIANQGEVFQVDSPEMQRNYSTAKIIVDELQTIGKNVHGPNIDNRIAPFAGEDGNIVFVSSEMPLIWGAAEADFQTIEGVAKEDRGMYAWLSYGLDNKSDGISLRESAYRIGAYIFDQIQKYNQGGTADFFLGISNSGFIEPHLYLTLDLIEGKEIEPIERFHKLGGATKPLEGFQINYQKKSPTANLILPDKTIVLVDIEVFREQLQWLDKYGITNEVIKNRT